MSTLNRKPVSKIVKKKTTKATKRKIRTTSKLKALKGVACTKRALDALVQVQSQAQVYKQTLRKAKIKKDTKTIEVVEKLLRELEKDKQIYLKKLSVAK